MQKCYYYKDVYRVRFASIGLDSRPLLTDLNLNRKRLYFSSYCLRKSQQILSCDLYCLSVLYGHYCLSLTSSGMEAVAVVGLFTPLTEAAHLIKSKMKSVSTNLDLCSINGIRMKGNTYKRFNETFPLKYFLTDKTKFHIQRPISYPRPQTSISLYPDLTNRSSFIICCCWNASPSPLNRLARSEKRKMEIKRKFSLILSYLLYILIQKHNKINKVELKWKCKWKT